MVPEAIPKCCVLQIDCSLLYLLNAPVCIIKDADQAVITLLKPSAKHIFQLHLINY